MNDRQLLDGFRAGSPDALRTVYRHYAARVTGQLRGGFTFTSAGRHMRFHGYQRPYDLENAAQEVFLHAFAPRARNAYDGLRPYGEYLLAIARNLVLNSLRRKEELFIEDEKPAAATHPAIEELFEHREVDRLLGNYVQTLAPRERDYFRVRFIDGLGQSEAARVLEMNRIVARRLETRLKLALLDHLKAHGYLESVPDAIVGSLATVKR